MIFVLITTLQSSSYVNTLCSNKCKTCSDKTYVCGGCSEYYFYNSQSRACQLGDVPNCKLYKTTYMCDTCEDGYRNLKGKCIQCTAKNCKYCASDIANCSQCIVGKTFTSTLYTGACTVDCSAKNCTQCAANSNNCITCDDGYYVDSNACSAISISNCKTLSGSACTSCLDGYYLSGNVCYACSTGCKVCTNLRCTECNDAGTTGYYMSTEFKCISKAYLSLKQAYMAVIVQAIILVVN